MKVAHKRELGKTLADFDLSNNVLREIVHTALAEAARVANAAGAPRHQAVYPLPAEGTVFYIHFVAGVRRHLLASGDGWRARNIQGLELTEHKARGVRIGYVATDEGTGSNTRQPRPIRACGPVAIAAAVQNEQLCLPLADDYLPARASERTQTWFLCVNRSRTACRLVLALPTKCTRGRFAGWDGAIPIDEVAVDSEPRLPSKSPGAAQPLPEARPKGKAATDTPGNDNS